MILFDSSILLFSPFLPILFWTFIILLPCSDFSCPVKENIACVLENITTFSPPLLLQTDGLGVGTLIIWGCCEWVLTHSVALSHPQLSCRIIQLRPPSVGSLLCAPSSARAQIVGILRHLTWQFWQPVTHKRWSYTKKNNWRSSCEHNWRQCIKMICSVLSFRRRQWGPWS